MELNPENEVKLLIDESSGIYIPQNFYENFDFQTWNIEKSDYTELSDTENQAYWDSWTELCDKAYYIDDKGLKWTLYQNGCLFAITERFCQLDDNDWFE